MAERVYQNQGELEEIVDKLFAAADHDTHAALNRFRERSLIMNGPGDAMYKAMMLDQYEQDGVLPSPKPASSNVPVDTELWEAYQADWATPAQAPVEVKTVAVNGHEHQVPLTIVDGLGQTAAPQIFITTGALERPLVAA